MNTPSAPQPERPSANGTNGTADDDAPLVAEQNELSSRPTGDLVGKPDREEESGWAGDDDDDEYEPL